MDPVAIGDGIGLVSAIGDQVGPDEHGDVLANRTGIVEHLAAHRRIRVEVGLESGA